MSNAKKSKNLDILYMWLVIMTIALGGMIVSAIFSTNIDNLNDKVNQLNESFYCKSGYVDSFSLEKHTKWVFSAHNSFIVDEAMWEGISYEGINQIEVINSSSFPHSGYYLFGGKIIMNLNKINSERMFEFVLLHELGHHVWVHYETDDSRAEICEVYQQKKDECLEKYADNWVGI